ncbi:probable carboxylesterase 8 [Tanacetum coccineum]
MPKTATRILPIIIYFHGGGFVFFSAKSFPFHKFCSIVSVESQVVVISVEYCLVPKHRLPAAYEDAMGVVYLMIDYLIGCFPILVDIFLDVFSAGGNIAYNACLRALDLDLIPIKIVGGTHLVWSLSLPEGSDRDHEYCNPLQDLDKSHSETIRLLPQCLIRGYGGDPLVDKQREFATMLETLDVHLITKFDNEGYHGVEIFDCRKHKR